MRNIVGLKILLVLLALAVGCAGSGIGVDLDDSERRNPSLKKNTQKEEIDENNDPAKLGFPIDRTFDPNTVVGEVVTVDLVPYPGNWFPQWNDGINQRWQWNYTSSLEEMGDEERKNLLSPSEKFDLAFNGWQIPEGFWGLKPMKKPGEEYDKEYYEKIGPASKWEHKNSGHNKSINGEDDDNDGEIDEKDNSGRYDGLENWFGHCNGWSSAALSELEPRKPVTVNGVKFEVSDIKAMLAELYFSDKSTFAGIRCEARPGALRKDETGRWLDSWLDFGGAELLSEKATVKQNEEKFFEVTAKGGKLSIKLTGDGDADLYVKKGSKPTKSDYDCRPYKDGSAENCDIDNAEGTYHILIAGYSETSDVELKVNKTGKLIEISEYSGPYWADSEQTKVKYTRVTFTDTEGVKRIGEIIIDKKEFFDHSKDAKAGELKYDGKTQATTYAMVRGCRDLNPGTLYLAMTQIIGKHKQGVVIDTSADYQVWNYPIYKYKINEQTIITKEEANEKLNIDRDIAYKYNDKATRFVFVKMDIWYVSDSISPRTTPALSIVSQYTTKQSLTFILEMDDTDKILGGEYTGESRYKHPDFIWIPFGYSENGIITKGTFLSYDDDKNDKDNPHLSYSKVKRLAMESSKKDDEVYKQRQMETLKTIAANGSTTSTINFTEAGSLKQIAVKMNITNVSLSGLKVTLVSPSGTEIDLLNYNGSGSKIDGVAIARPWVHDGTLEIGLNKLTNEALNGEWKLKITNSRSYSGKLNSWSMMVVYEPGPGVACQADSCSGNGTCSVADNALVCACNDGYTGSDCSTCAAGYHDEDGTCVKDDDEPNTDVTSFDAEGTVTKDQEKTYTVVLPEGAKNIKVNLTGTGDADLYTNFGVEPTTSKFACRPYKYGSVEECLHASATDNKLFVKVRGWDPTSDFKVVVTWEVGEPGDPGDSISLNESFTVTKDQQKTFVLKVGAESKTVNVQISGDGDGDLYVKKGTGPTTSSYDCRPYLWGSVEACTLENVTGDVHIMVRGYDPTSEIQLTATAQ